MESILSTFLINWAFESCLGSLEYKPLVSVSIISKLASTIDATNADNLSLSPKLAPISSIVITSFSFTIGIIPISSNLFNVFLTFN